MFSCVRIGFGMLESVTFCSSEFCLVIGLGDSCFSAFSVLIWTKESCWYSWLFICLHIFSISMPENQVFFNISEKFCRIFPSVYHSFPVPSFCWINFRITGKHFCCLLWASFSVGISELGSWFDHCLCTWNKNSQNW